MKKNFAALLFAGATLGFAKDNVQNQKSTNIESSKVESNVEKPKTIYQFGSLEEAQKFFAECTDVTYAFGNVVVDYGNGESHIERRIISSCETTYPCVSGGTSVYVINL